MKDKVIDFVTTARADLRTAAQLLLFWEAQGITIKSRSHLIELTLNAFADMITAKESASEITGTEYALRVLRERGLMDKPIRNIHTLIKTLSLEDIKEERQSKTVLSESDEEEALGILAGFGDDHGEDL